MSCLTNVKEDIKMNNKGENSETKRHDRKVRDFDDILKYVGGWGPFQYLLCLIFCPFNMFYGYVNLSPILILFTPPHWCQVPEMTNITMELRKQLTIPLDASVPGGFSQCMQYAANWTKVISENLKTPDPSWPVEKCQSGWEYPLEDFHRSVTVQFDWVCNDAWIPAFSQSVFFFGAIPGMLFFGWFSDTYGRLPTIMITNMIALVAGIATPFVTGHFSFITLRFVMGLAYNTCFTGPYVLVLEFVEGSKKTLVGNLGLAIFFTLSGLVQPLVMRLLGDWRLFSWVIFSQIGLVVFLPIVLPESCRWLIAKGKAERAVKILKKMAKMNKKEVPDFIYDDLISLANEKENKANTSHSYTYLDLFKNAKMRRITLLAMMLWMLTSLVFDTTARNVTNLNFNIYTSFIITVALEIPADLLSIVSQDYLGRRWSAALSLFTTGVSMLICSALVDQWEAQAAVFMIGRFSATFAMNVGFLFIVEVLPTQLRGQGISLVNVMSMLAQMLSPYIVYSSVLSNIAPFLMMGLIGLLAAVPGLFLPETAGTSLPDSLEELEGFGRHERFFWAPVCGAKRRYRTSKDQSGAEMVGNTNWQTDLTD